MNDNKIACGIDIGTMNLCCSRSDSDEVKITRNVFLTVDKEDILNQLSKINYVEGPDDTYIIGSDAFDFANMFGKKLSRPMENGLISPKEIDAVDVLTLMVKDLIGVIKDKEVFCSYSIPAPAIDNERSVTYHEKVFGRILHSIGVNYKSVNEAMAVIYSECTKESFSGIGISFGAGMANVAVAYKGIEALTFSTTRSGDWIDNNVAKDLNMVPNRVTSLKERHMQFDISLLQKIKKKTHKRVLEALLYQYENMINYTIKKIIKEFDDKVDVEIDDELPIVISGGTSIPEGFVSLFSERLNQYELPFEISEVRRAKNPLTAVSNGLLVRTIADIKNK